MNLITDALRAAVSTSAMVAALAGVGLNMQFGYAGLLNFGHVAFLMAGSYGIALVVADLHLSLWVGVPVGIGLATAVALLFGLPTLRLRADYLAIVTISTAEILRLLVRSNAAEPYTHGTFPITDFARDFYAINPFPPGDYGIGTFRFSERALWVLLIGWCLVALTSVMTWLVMRGPWGRVLRAMRDDEDATRSLGKNVFSFKLQTLLIGGVIASFAGMLLAIDTQSVQPDIFLTTFTFSIYAAVILGGRATVLGPVVGSMSLFALIALIEGSLRYMNTHGWITISDQQVGALRIMLFGAALMGLMVFRPQGILGRREEGLLDA